MTPAVRESIQGHPSAFILHRSALAMALYTLRLHADRLEPKAEFRLGRCNRVVYVRDGDAIVRAGRCGS